MPGPAFRSADSTELRAIESEDHEFLAAEWNTRDVRLPTNTYEPLTARDVAGFVGSDESVNFVVCADGEPVGAAWLFGIAPVHGRGELGYWTAEGHATTAARLLVEYAVAEQRLRKLTARVFEGNEASKRVLEKVGFEEAGHLRDHYYIDGELLDATLYAYFDE
ncbi:GNAT family N-acetyltransferase [Halobacteriales archaeon SW_10_66_29]|nr:MAG: GNAT family N-acetyltransferase [Halobacteriales archaeon SW_10_66_29]